MTQNKFAQNVKVGWVSFLGPLISFTSNNKHLLPLLGGYLEISDIFV